MAGGVHGFGYLFVVATMMLWSYGNLILNTGAIVCELYALIIELTRHTVIFGLVCPIIEYHVRFLVLGVVQHMFG